ncbi:hypothetical protein LSUE1_G008117 [Lachnellula suecica]|uniref:Peptidase A1 domain-containing protein n=1 Tax=Lachnellula suecica TaxID=602035 RepID=A0A8T9C002_9HELO|nr:hypothetical protein LSUE1_G008117 [Lachnellula suecica]
MRSRSALLAFMVLQLLGLPGRLDATATSSSSGVATPTPLVVPPSQSWDGNDGPWSSFSLRVGTPPLNLNVMLSTASNQPLVVLPEGCLATDPSDCPNSRGRLFQTNLSSSYYVPSWIRNNNSTKGIFSIGIDTNLGLSGDGAYGYDNVSYGVGTPSLSDQLVGGISTKDFFLGLLGVNPSATTFSENRNPVPSYLTSLKTQNLIPSLSYGYTAGNQYRFNKVLGSLTLGGFDASLFEPNDLTVDFSALSNLMIDVNKITMSSANGGNITLGSTSFPAFIDSTVPYLYLPVAVCQQFEDAFGIVYDTASELYLVNDTSHTKLLSQAANITFTLTTATSKVLVDIVLPYQAFDLIAQWPLVQNDTRYFPLKRAANNTQTTLGRAFLQEAYLIADYERSNFSIYQRKWEANTEANIQTISLPSSSPPTQPAAQKKLGIGIVIAIAVGGAVLCAAGIAGLIFILRRRNQNRCPPGPPSTVPQSSPRPSPSPLSFDTYYTTSTSSQHKDIIYKPVMLSPSFTYSSTELDAVSNELKSPEMGGGAVHFQPLPEKSKGAIDHVHELPARETVDYDRFASRNARWV